jgi:DNA-directed RNA polymerase specialized sigma subunit
MSPPRRTRSTKIRQQQKPAAPDIRAFPAPTEWSEQLAHDNLRLAKAMAFRMAKATRMPFDDLYLEASIGLLKGCRLYDPNRINAETGKSYRLSTCVVPYIRGAMAQWLRNRGIASGVKFSVQWRDKGPTVRRLTSAGASMDEIAAATGMSPQDVESLLKAQGATLPLDPDAFDLATSDPDPWDETEIYEELSEAMRIADLAHAALRPADQAMIERQWDSTKRRQLARLPHDQFMLKARGIIRGESGNTKTNSSFTVGEQHCLALELPESSEGGMYGSKKRLTEPRDILQAAEQLAIARGNEDNSGKTAIEASDLEGENSGDQPSNKSGQPPELPPSGTGGGLQRSGPGGGLLGAAEGQRKETALAEGRRGATEGL